MITIQMHLEIAKERFLEIMANEPNVDPSGAAITSIEQADAFVQAYRAIGPAEEAGQKKLKGCSQCFGSGGRGKGCKVCGGTGKVEA